MTPDQRAGRGPMPGLAVAACAAGVSGVSVFVNAYAVHSFTNPSVYTTAKNIVAALVLGACAAAGWGTRHAPRATIHPGRRDSRAVPTPRQRLGAWIGLAYVGIIGGGLAFVLFFNGLARTTAEPAAFWHDTLIVWVGLLAVVFLRERLRWWNVGAIALLVIGQAVLSGGIGKLAADRGELLVLAATLLWAVEVIVAKKLLETLSPSYVAVVRMTVGSVTLIVYLAATSALNALVSMGLEQLGWTLLTGCLLAAYVGTWMTALSRARALDVTSVLVASVALTWLLEVMAGTVTPSLHTLGLVLVVIGIVAVVVRTAPARSRGPGLLT